MKQLYFLIALGSFFVSTSQTLTQSFNEPVVGDIDKRYRLDTSAYTSGIPVSATGSTVVWDFSKFTGFAPMAVDSFIFASAATDGSAHPTASFAQHRDDLYTFYKSSNNPSQTELLGAYSPSLSLTFTNSAIIATYPVSYGYNLSDPVSGTFKANGTTGAGNGSITISCESFGTANMPNNVSIQNVLCLKSVEILTLSVGVFPFGTFNQTIYNYYMPGKKFPILNINYTTYQLIGNTPTLTAVIFGSDNYFTTVGIPESSINKNNYTVYPNPFHDALFERSNNSSDENTYLVFDLNGRAVINTNSLSDTKFKILNSGIYILETKNKSGTFRQKIIKE